MGEVNYKNLTIILLIVGIGILAIAIFGVGGIGDLVKRIKPPNVEITTAEARRALEGWDHVVYVDVSVHNHGGSGTVVIWCEITQGDQSWKKSKNIHLDLKESRDLNFRFSEVGVAGFKYQVWGEY